MGRESCAQVYNELSPVYFWETKGKHHRGIINAHTTETLSQTVSQIMDLMFHFTQQNNM